ncbi:hypothetical protein IQ268_31510 [Oculatella sp. LEGE 06141]|uniref:hypothetical protein n=1 Tax=Oculatella sp. LEGE 06141 TaxID=1828648 RepID=UPI0018824D0D|nr:hypothetical protein [Oculatella sp. LEGE 06141]MBE9183065.1 hypothetical protein [Oculatella sp. LEGE 06141]
MTATFNVRMFDVNAQRQPFGSNFSRGQTYGSNAAKRQKTPIVEIGVSGMFMAELWFQQRQSYDSSRSFRFALPNDINWSNLACN